MKKSINAFIFILYNILFLFLIFLFKDILDYKELIILILTLSIIELIFIYLLKKDILLYISYPCIIIIIIFLLGFEVKTTDVFSFVSNVVTNNNIINNYRVIGLKNKYQKLDDLKNKKIGYTKDTIGFNNLDIKFESICYDSYEDLLNDLDTEKIDAAIILASQYSLLDENKYRIIYKMEFKEEVIPVSNNYNNTSLIYINSYENYDSSNFTSKSDINILMGVNTKTKQILFISIPSNYYVLLPRKGEKDRISHASMYGMNEAIKTVEKLLENNIDYYIKIDLKALEKLIDKIDGIEIDSEYSFISSGIEFKKGLNRLNGKEALVFASELKGLVGGDRAIGENQEKVIEATIKKILKNDDYFEIIDEIKDAVKTNIPEKKILKMIKDQIAYKYNWNTTKYLLNGLDSYEYTYSYKCCKLNVINPDVTTIHEAITLIEYLKSDGIFK